MGARVFISYAFDRDGSIAVRTKQALEQAGLRPWMAPDDVPAGVPYQEAIVSAISSSAVVIVVMSRATCESSHILNELALAEQHRVPILPFVVEQADWCDWLMFHVAARHWLDGTRSSIHEAVSRLTDAVRRLAEGRPAESA